MPAQEFISQIQYSMKIVNITGGLGNQMFQYSFALALKHRHPEEDVYIDIQHYHTIFFKKYKSSNLHNGYELDKIFLGLKLPIAGFKQLVKVSYWIPNYVLSRIMRKVLPIRKTEWVSSFDMDYAFDEKALLNANDCYYEGYWQAVGYYSGIKEELRKVFAHPTPNSYNADMIRKIRSSESVGVHVRRGDYLQTSFFKGICELDYYKKAITELLKDKKKHTFFVFSNDIEWCKENLLGLMQGYECVFVTENKGKNSCWDMFLMTYCKDLIIANSSFSWWGAFLNKDVKRVYAPYPWLNGDCKLEVYDESWVKVL